MIQSYFKYRLRSVNAHGLHSPFVFQFYNEVVCKAGSVNDKLIRDLRNKLKRDQRELDVIDFGAGSRKNSDKLRSIAEIAKNAGMNSKYGRLLYRLIDYYQVKKIVELGTSLGIGSLYMGTAPCVESLLSVEGDQGLASVAREHLNQFNLSCAEVITGKFDEQLEEVIRRIPQPDLVFIDGNHRFQPTLDYFHFFVKHIPDDGFLIFDDIYWSEEMQEAWKQIIASPEIHVSIDLFRFGIVCKKPGQAKEYFVLRY